jgi:hypothetical protein
MAKKNDDGKTKTTGEKFKEGAKNVAGDFIKKEAEESKRGILALLWSFLFGGLFGDLFGSSGEKRDPNFKDNRYIWTTRDERYYFNARSGLNSTEQKRLGQFEKQMKKSEYDWDFFRKNIANIQDEYEQAKKKKEIPANSKNPATKKLRMITKEKTFNDQMLIVGFSLGQEEFFEKKNVKKIDKAIGSILMIVASSVFLILMSLFVIVLVSL